MKEEETNSQENQQQNRSYWKDDQISILDVEDMVNMNKELSDRLCTISKELKPPQKIVAKSARGKFYNELSMENLRYLVFGSYKVDSENKLYAYANLYQLLIGPDLGFRHSNERLLGITIKEIQETFGHLAVQTAQPVQVVETSHQVSDEDKGDF